ncbi:hypothetical protein [Legionella maioricensis]|uniref:Uncharacterized protein n=1 Tax=Legionella maioricensis TaxID=2896528 RepID=A0A9X2D1S9_9GAMM|nr:hypothetical protein [Legionella maioricensis]MCL9684838.1 hypothetical protein [Legionella maioricensis]MCL9688518.1 hypothetical protein [Legionella maioricensis]
MNSSIVSESQRLITQANQLLADSQALLIDLGDDSESSDAASFDINVKIIQLLLEYRLSSQDALSKVLSLDHNLIALLGIEPKHAASTNLDRLTYALGSEDLRQILHALSQLVDYLLKVVHSYQKNQQQLNRYNHMHKESKPSKLLMGMQKLVMQQKKLLSLLDEMGKNLEQITQVEAIGPLYDHIAALRGPISQFFQAIQHGIGLAHELYQKTNKEVPLEHSLAHVLQQIEEVLEQMPSIYKPHPHYQAPPPALETVERLEQRASTKRLSPFFNH